MKSRTITIAATIAALAFATAPVAAVAAAPSHHRTSSETQLDRSRDAKGDRHVRQAGRQGPHRQLARPARSLRHADCAAGR